MVVIFPSSSWRRKEKNIMIEENFNMETKNFNRKVRL